MFGRKKKQDDSTGLAGLGIQPSVTVAPAPGAQAQSPAVQTAGVTSVSVNPNPQAVLSQILSGHGPVGELVAQIKADPIGFRNRMIAQAQAAGVSTFVMTPQGMTPLGAGGAAAAQHVDVVDELTKAADLHDKGALTDAEFEALKKKLLGE